MAAQSPVPVKITNPGDIGGGGGGGDATAANQAAGNASLSSIDTKLTTLAGYVDTLETLIAATNAAIGSTNGFVDGIEGLLGTLNGYVDGVEALIGTTNSSLTTLQGYVDGLETLVGSTNTALASVNTNLTTIDGHVDGLEGVAGTTADAAVITDVAGSLSAKLRGIIVLLGTQATYLDGVETLIGTTNTKLNGGLPTALGAGGGVKVDGSGTALPVSGTVTANAGTGTLAVSGPVTDTQLRATAVPVSGTVTANAGTGTLAVSAASLPLPSGASTAAKQPALGTAGSASTDVITVQGIASGTAQPASQSGTWTVQPGNTANTTAWKVDGSAVTQPVSTPSYTAPVCGELAGSTSALQLPAITCKLVQFKAAAANAGKVYLGGSGVTKVDATTDTTTGIQLSAGESTGWIPIDNLNRLYRICDNAGDALTYLAMN